MEEEEEDHISLDNLLKDLERQTNFDEFLPYAENKKRELLPDDILPSPFSPVSDYKDKFFKKEIKRKLIIPIRSLPLKFEGKTTTCFSQYMNEIVREKIKFNRKKTKVDEIFNLQEKNLTVCKKNLKKILPKINKNISHTISGLLNSN